jgi:NAD(P)-dependent dehydrogenase (short-subunit alcohol dehydrogenase family)
MEQFAGRVAVVTGGGTGMGRELVRQLSAEGCHVATCDVSAENLEETVALAGDRAGADVVISTFVADVSNEQQLQAFRDHVASAHATDHVHLLFNNAGIGGGGSFVHDDRAEWEQVFNVCWGGVYLGTRTFLPMLLAAPEGHVVNTSSVNGFWATLGGRAHTAYSAAKFAVKGFTEALITDFRLYAPHLRASVVMPGHIGTSIVFNSGSYFGRHPKELSGEHLQQIRNRFDAEGVDLSAASDEDVRSLMVTMAEAFRDQAPTTAAEAAAIILDGVRAGDWRILIGDDAHRLDEAVRADPVQAYEPEFFARLQREGVFGNLAVNEIPDS